MSLEIECTSHRGDLGNINTKNGWHNVQRAKKYTRSNILNINSQICTQIYRNVATEKSDASIGYKPDLQHSVI